MLSRVFISTSETTWPQQVREYHVDKHHRVTFDSGRESFGCCAEWHQKYVGRKYRGGSVAFTREVGKRVEDEGLLISRIC